MHSIVSDQKRVAVGLSGGVDSSVAAYLLKEQGYDVVGVHLQCWDARADGCKAEEDRAYAVRTVAHLGIKFEHIDYQAQYKDKVIEYFYKEYASGRTPNPDVMCNKEIKFGLFFDWAVENGFDYVATGHYARILHCHDQISLLKGSDPSKDQSYFLYLLDQEHLAKTLFPIGDMYKKDVREIAKNENLPAFNRPDSTGICFIGEVDIKEFLKQKLKVEKGNVIDINGNVIGEHDGAWFYTIGQRHGFKINKYQGVPVYIIDKNNDKNELIVGSEKDAEKSSFKASNLHWISGTKPANTSDLFDCDVRIRHLGKIQPAKVKINKSNTANIDLSESMFAVAPGQSVVFYRGDEVLGGGIIN